MRNWKLSSYIERDPGAPGCRGTGGVVMVLLGGLALLGACGAQPEDTISEDELVSQLGGAFDDLDRSKDACVQSRLATRGCYAEELWKRFIAGGCGAFGMELTDLKVVERCDTGGARKVEFQCCPRVADPPNPPPLQCVADALGDDTSCKPEATWKEYVSQACEAKGLRVARLSLADRCGDGLFRHVKFECCKVAAPPPPPPPECFASSLGDDTSCKPEATWKENATRVCAARDSRVTRIDYAEACGERGSFRFTKFECCKAATPPPPPPPPRRCVVEAQGGDTSCKPEATWKDYASQACTAKGLKLDGVSFTDRCGDGLFRWAKYSCCE